METQEKNKLLEIIKKEIKNKKKIIMTGMARFNEIV